MDIVFRTQLQSSRALATADCVASACSIGSSGHVCFYYFYRPSIGTVDGSINRRRSPDLDELYLRIVSGSFPYDATCRFYLSDPSGILSLSLEKQ